MVQEMYSFMVANTSLTRARVSTGPTAYSSFGQGMACGTTNNTWPKLLIALGPVPT